MGGITCFFAKGKEGGGRSLVMYLKFTIVRLGLRVENVSLRHVVASVVNASLL